MNKVSLVIDTNVFLVSLAPKFRLHWIFKYLIEGKFDLCVTTDILYEYQEIISSRYGLIKTDSTLGFLLLLSNVHQISPHFKWNILKDKDDNKLIDCSDAGNADFIISNDKGFLLLKEVEFPQIEILTSLEFEASYKNKFDNK